MQRSLLASCMAVVLAACSTISYQGDENSPYFEVPQDSRFVLTQPLSIPPDKVGVFLQYGQVMRFAEVDKYKPHCKFELYTLRPDSRTVAPDEFVVTRAQQEDSLTSIGTPLHAGVMLTGLSMGGSRHGGNPVRVFSTRMTLRSEKQPDVFRLTCAHWVYRPNDRHVTIAEMRRALGEVMTLDLAGRQ